MVPKIGQFGK